VLDIPDDIQEYASYENSTVSDKLYGNGEIGQLSGEKEDGKQLSAAELEEAAAASVKPDKHFGLFKEATATNSCQVLY